MKNETDIIKRMEMLKNDNYYSGEKQEEGIKADIIKDFELDTTNQEQMKRLDLLYMYAIYIIPLDKIEPLTEEETAIVNDVIKDPVRIGPTHNDDGSITPVYKKYHSFERGIAIAHFTLKTIKVKFNL